jgi:glycosyltransferase involved in cell wall biosynthesis
LHKKREKALGSTDVEATAPLLSVVIPCRNAERTLGTQLGALARESWNEPWEVVVADNGSTDATTAVAETFRDRLQALRIVDASERAGVAFARNRAVAESTGELIAFCDADDEVGSGWLAAMGEALVESVFVAARPEYATLNPPWIHESWDPPPEDGLRTHRFPPYLRYAGGGCLGIRRAVHDELGGFDESLPSCEDDDYCFRVQRAGYDLVAVPRAVVHIRLRTRARDLFSQARWYAEGEARLQRKFGGAVTARTLWKWPLLHWGAIARTFPHVGSRSGRARLAWLLGFQLGRYRGSIVNRVLAI